MHRYRNSLAVPALFAMTLISAGPAAARVAAEPDYQDKQLITQELTDVGESPKPPIATGERALSYLNRIAKEQAFDGKEGTGFPSYPGGGAGGTSNGDLSAAERGEPVGAGGTSGGSMSPFALASKK
jgi:hypothetical protein